MNAIDLEVWRHLFGALTEEMGAALMRSAFSPNIKERRDFSCALFDPGGEMIAHAAHIPVHLGSTPLCVTAILDALELQPGDAALVNDPYAGGTHLPDITVMAPVHQGDQLLGYVVNRAHHADVGGTAPGSMPLSSSIDDEGVRIAPLRIRAGGQVLDALLDERLFRHVRTPDERRGDLAAQLAACGAGAHRLEALAERYGRTILGEAMEALADHAERTMRATLRELADGTYEAQDLLDDDGLGHQDIALRVRIELRGDEATIDFSGCDDQVEGPLNAVRAIVVSATVYVFRCLAPDHIPASTGMLRPLTIITRRGSVVDAEPPAPVAGGNVETSQRLVDILFRALAPVLPERIPACSQGTMNNVALGGTDPEPWAYYETLGGGTGAGPDYDGESAIHSHMTNTLNTPIEALEHAYPLRVEWYRIRRNSGGDGAHRGGDGLERAWRFLAPGEATLLGERRRHPPPGLLGGGDGAPGADRLILADGTQRSLPGKVQLKIERDQILVVATPGGGGHGTK